MRQAMFRASDELKDYIEGETDEQDASYVELARDENSRVCIGTQLQHADSVF